MSVRQSNHVSPQKAYWAACVFASLAALAFILFNLPYRYQEWKGEWVAQSTIEFRSTTTGEVRNAIRAGFPMRFYDTRESLDARRPPIWSTRNLVLNLVAMVVSVAIVFYVSRLRYRLIQQSPASNRKRTLLDASTGTAFVAIISVVSLNLYQETQRHRRLARNPNLNGSCYLSCEVPSIIANKLPPFANQFLTRVRSVNSRRPSRECLEEVFRLKSLNGLLIQATAVEASQLKALGALPNFSSLQLNFVNLTAEHVATIGQIQQLESLDLSYTNLDGSLLRNIDKLQHLRSVSFAGTPLKLAELGAPEWKTKVRRLELPRQVNGPEDRLTIDRWQAIEAISISNPSVLVSPATIHVEITNCPQLRRVAIDRSQKHNLVVKNLPKFQDVIEEVNEDNYFGTTLDGVARDHCFGIVHLENVPSLRELGACANELTSLRIINAPSLNRLTISKGEYEDLTDSNFGLNQSVALQKIIDDIGACNGPTDLSFDSLDFRQVSLQALTNNKHIRNVSFLRSTIDFSQIRQLAGLSRLRSIVAALCKTSSEDLAWLLKSFPELKKMDFDIADVDELTLTSQSNLEFLAGRQLKQVKSVRLQDVPELAMDLHVDCPVEELQVVDAPKLTGLGLAAPWPTQAKIEGLRGLKWFAAGGTSVDHSVLDSVLSCRSLDRLMLAYPSLSKETLKRVGNFAELTSLVLPGAGVDDSVTSSFKKLKMLREVNFDDCNVDVSTIEWLLGIESMRRLSINHVDLSPDASILLTRMKQLNELEIAGVEVSDDVFSALVTDLRLEHLNIADHKLTNNEFENLQHNQSLRLLNVCGCGLSRDKIQQLLEANESLVICFEPAPLEENIEIPVAAGDDLRKPIEARLIDKKRYLQIRLHLANYSVLQDSSMRDRYYSGDVDSDKDQSLFGWFDASRFRTKSGAVIN